MTHADDDARPAQDDAPRVAPIRVTCPHCGRSLDVVPVLVAAPLADADPAQPVRSPAARAGHVVLRAVQHRFFPFSAAAMHPETPAGAPENGFTRPSLQSRAAIVLLVLGIAVVAALLIWLGRPASAWGHVEPTQAAPTARLDHAATNTGSLNGDEAAILDTLTRANRAESEAAASLTIAPLQPYMDANGPFAERRTAQLAERRRRNAPHRSILVRWAIGRIRVAGTTATAVTQETWSNQEAGAVAPEQATVRVTYTLHWDAAVGRWLIVESEQMGL